MREAEEQNNQSSIDPTTGQFIPPPLHPPNPPLNGGGDQKMVIFNKIYCNILILFSSHFGNLIFGCFWQRS